MRIIFLLLTALPISLLAQENFEWDIRDSIPLSKDAIYANAKQFIAETWNSPDEVIKNDDKESGIILLRGIYRDQNFYMLNPHEFSFEYQIKFQMKEGQFRLVIEDVRCKSHTVATNVWPAIPISETYPGRQDAGSMKEALYIELMADLKSTLQSIADRYVEAMNEEPASDDW